MKDVVITVLFLSNIDNKITTSQKDDFVVSNIIKTTSLCHYLSQR